LEKVKKEKIAALSEGEGRRVRQNQEKGENQIGQSAQKKKKQGGNGIPLSIEEKKGTVTK